MPEQIFQQGQIIVIQFDAQTAFLGLELTQESGLREGIPGLGLLAQRQGVDDEFSAGAFVVEFLVSTASGITATAVTALVSKILSKRGKSKGLTIIVEPLPKAPEDDSLRLGVTLEEQPNDLQ